MDMDTLKQLASEVQAKVEQAHSTATRKMEGCDTDGFRYWNAYRDGLELAVDIIYQHIITCNDGS